MASRELLREVTIGVAGVAVLGGIGVADATIADDVVAHPADLGLVW